MDLHISTEMTMLSPEWIRSVISSSDYRKALDVIDENIDVILNDELSYAFWKNRI